MFDLHRQRGSSGDPGGTVGVCGEVRAERAPEPPGVSTPTFQCRPRVSLCDGLLCVCLRAWVCVSGPLCLIWICVIALGSHVWGCSRICEPLCVSLGLRLPPALPDRALNATLLPECAEECGGQGERGARGLAAGLLAMENY